MKRIAFITLFMALSLNVISQETKNDTIVVDGDKVEILIKNNKVKIADSPKGLKINVFSITENGEVEKYPYYESRYESNTSSDTEKKNITINFPINPTFIKDDSYTSDDKRRKLKFYSFDPIYPTIYYAYSMMVGYPMTQSLNYYASMTRSNSFEWGSYLIQYDIWHNKQNTIGLTTALGFSNAYYYSYYILGTTTTENSNNFTYFYHPGNLADNNPIPDGMPYTFVPTTITGGYFRYWSLRMPVSFQTQWRVGNNKMAFSIGAEIEWRFAMKSFAYLDNSKYMIADNLAYDPFGVNALAVISFKDFVIIGRAGLTYLFNQHNSCIRTMPVNIGIGFTF